MTDTPYDSDSGSGVFLVLERGVDECRVRGVFARRAEAQAVCASIGEAGHVESWPLDVLDGQRTRPAWKAHIGNVAGQWLIGPPQRHSVDMSAPEEWCETGALWKTCYAPTPDRAMALAEVEVQDWDGVSRELAANIDNLRFSDDDADIFELPPSTTADNFFVVHTMRLTYRDHTKADRIAQQNGADVPALLRQWIEQRLAQHPEIDSDAPE